MDAFDRLTPALRYQIVNGLGWSALRPVQEETIHAVLDGCNCVVLAPTAGGKTEAAFFPLISRMDAEDLAPPSVLYVAPIRALLNNQAARLERLTALVGRRAFTWHGDVGASPRKRFIRDPADVLSITPESLEAMLASPRVPATELLRNVRAVVVDEIHAFAGDDRGAHLAAILERVCRVSAYDVQRVGLSATVGDPDVIAGWLAGSSERPRRVVDPRGPGADPELSVDYVGNLENAALMVEKLFRGTRRLVFVDSRRRVEELGDLLNRRGVQVHVSHSSLSASERHAAERAFEEGQDCAIVATSALELGLDVGDLDHVVQVDAPATVSSFLQRMGRTGRRPGARPNCTFLATSEDAVLQAAALLRLRARGYVEPAAPSRRAVHILAHQVLALGLQETGVPAATWWEWLDGCAAFDGLEEEERGAVVDHMLAEDIIAESGGRLALGQRGEKLYGRRNFSELYAVFSTPRVLTVLHGSQEVGAVDAWFLQQKEDGPQTFVLGGRPWLVTAVNWKGGTVHVTPAEAGAYPRWFGRPVLLSHALCQSMAEVLRDDAEDAPWSRRAREVMARLRTEHTFLHEASAPLVNEVDRVRWWTFAGGRANALLAGLLEAQLGEKVSSGNLAVTLSGRAAASDAGIGEALRAIAAEGVSWGAARRFAPDSARERISKFQPCLPEALELDLVARSLLDVDGGAAALAAATGEVVTTSATATSLEAPPPAVGGLGEALDALSAGMKPVPPEKPFERRPPAAAPTGETTYEVENDARGWRWTVKVPRSAPDDTPSLREGSVSYVIQHHRSFFGWFAPGVTPLVRALNASIRSAPALTRPDGIDPGRMGTAADALLGWMLTGTLRATVERVLGRWPMPARALDEAVTELGPGEREAEAPPDRLLDALFVLVDMDHAYRAGLSELPAELARMTERLERKGAPEGGFWEQAADRVTSAERDHVVALASRLRDALPSGAPVVYNPTFGAWGAVKGGDGDVWVGDSLVEIKSGQKFEARDLRQLLTYTLLHEIRRREVFDPAGFQFSRTGIWERPMQTAVLLHAPTALRFDLPVGWFVSAATGFDHDEATERFVDWLSGPFAAGAWCEPRSAGPYRGEI